MINDSEIDELHEVVKENAPDAIIQGKSQNFLCYRIAKSEINQLIAVFSKLESYNSQSYWDSSCNRTSWSSDRGQSSRYMKVYK